MIMCIHCEMQSHALSRSNIFAIDKATNLSTLFRKDVSTSFVSLSHYDGAVTHPNIFFLFLSLYSLADGYNDML